MDFNKHNKKSGQPFERRPPADFERPSHAYQPFESSHSNYKPASRRVGGPLWGVGGLAIGFVFGIAFWFIFAFLADFDLRSSNRFNRDLPKNLDYDSVEKIYDEIRAQYDGPLSEEELLIGLKKGLVEATGDPHSFYYSTHESEQLYSNLEGELVGVGIYIDQKGDDVVIVAPIDGSPAAKAGLKSGDIILKVDDHDIRGMGTQQVANLMRGEEGTDVVLTVHRWQKDNRWKDLSFTLTRTKLDIPSVVYKVQNGVGILELKQFNLSSATGKANTVQGLRQATNLFRRENIKGLVLDLRLNPGGDLETTHLVASFWLKDSQTIFQLGNYKRQMQEVLKAGESGLEKEYRGALYGIPLVILVDQGSASASEVLLLALLDNGLGQSIGQKTYGKTTVQRLFELENGEVLRLTTQHWYSPTGRSVEGGYSPGIIIEDDPTTEDVDEVVEKALELLKED